MNDFLKQYGAMMIAGTIGLILVGLGIFGHSQIALDTGILSLGGSAGIHIGGNTNAVPVKLEDALAVIQKAQAPVAEKETYVPGKVASATDQKV